MIEDLNRIQREIEKGDDKYLYEMNAELEERTKQLYTNAENRKLCEMRCTVAELEAVKEQANNMFTVCCILAKAIDADRYAAIVVAGRYPEEA